MKRFLRSVLIISSLLIGVASMASCSCQKQDMPFGVVEGVTVYPDWVTPLAYDDDGNAYRRMLVTADVANKGADGFVVFHIRIKDSLTYEQDSQSFVLIRDGKTQIDWVFYAKVMEVAGEEDRDYVDVATVQAVNVSEYIDALK